MTTFADLGLSDETLNALNQIDYTTPTPIQEKAIPILLMGRDVLGCAQTGTGKTASFILPMVEILASGKAKAKMPRSIVLAPTRELAMQVADNFDLYTKNQPLTKALLIGGVHMGEQAKQLTKGVDVLIATPGRLMDFLDRGEILTTDVKMVVIDEADRMLDMGFIPDIEKIVSALPPLRQTVMFSATMPREIRKLADKFLMNPKEITITPPATTATTVTQYMCKTSPRGKLGLLKSLLDSQNVENGIVFCNRKSEVSSLCKQLTASGYSAGSLHGDMNQYQRMETLQAFKDNSLKILVCSDVAARGLDIPTVSHVFNYDLPNQPEDYVHRIGRTGRAGRTGTAFAFVTDRDDKALAAIEKNIKTPIAEFTESGRKSGGKKQNEKDNRPQKNNNRDNRPNKQQEKHPEKKANRPEKQNKNRENNAKRYNSQDDHYIESLPSIQGNYSESDQVPSFLNVSIHDNKPVKKATAKKAPSKKTPAKTSKNTKKSKNTKTSTAKVAKPRTLKKSKSKTAKSKTSKSGA